MITVVDYGMGNVGSVQNMLFRLGHDSILSADPEQVRRADKIILPGVGAFDVAMEALERLGLVQALHQRVRAEGAPLLGICLGMQLLSRSSEEGQRPGLGWVPATTRRFRFEEGAPQRVPHMGWRTVRPTRPHPVLKHLDADARFYFVHSYHVVCDDPGDELLEADYGGRFCAALASGNVIATQFHPEKSHRHGLALLSAFAEGA